jgi:CRISPR type III-B/RAMP module RAMP protein Cmr1
MTWTTLSLQVTTPLFNGGADPDGDLSGNPAGEPGIRTSSIRGAMRFWYRAFAGAVTGPDLNLLSATERKIFGSTEHASPVMLRIPSQPAVIAPGVSRNFLADRPVTPDQRQWLIYLLGQSLGDMQKHRIRRPYVSPGQEFELKLKFRHHESDDEQTRTAIETLAFASLWLMCAYGGAGARTRRGFGGLKITAASRPLPGPWNASSILTPGLDHYENLRWLWPAGPVGACVPSLPVLTGRPITNPRETWQGATPSFPVLSVTHAPARTSQQTFPSWQDTLIEAGSLLRWFRADKENTRPAANYRPKIESREWREVVHGSDTRFQLGALGLPVVFNRDTMVDVVKTSNGEQARRASPLWLRPVGAGDRWRLLSFAFNTEFLPPSGSAAVRLSDRGQRKTLTVTDQDVVDLTGEWIQALAGGREPGRPPTRP